MKPLSKSEINELIAMPQGAHVNSRGWRERKWLDSNTPEVDFYFAKLKTNKVFSMEDPTRAWLGEIFFLPFASSSSGCVITRETIVIVRFRSEQRSLSSAQLVTQATSGRVKPMQQLITFEFESNSILHDFSILIVHLNHPASACIICDS